MCVRRLEGNSGEAVSGIERRAKGPTVAEEFSVCGGKELEKA